MTADTVTDKAAPKAQAMSAEQAADFAALNASAAGAEPVAGAAPEQQQGPQPPSAAALGMAGMVLGILRPILGMASPALKDAPGELWEPVTGGLAVMADHYNLTDNDLFKNPWARFAFSVAPLTGYVVVQSMSAEAKKIEKTGDAIAGALVAAKDAGMVDSPKTVTFGNVPV